MLAAKKFEPYIRYIRFPLFRNLRPGLQIDFTHPITALVGPNGSNKTAILRALQGCPDYYDLGQYWYSTSLDPISENDRHRFIHGLWAPSAGEVVEAIKTRIRRGANPDAWEPSRPLLQDGMKRMPKLADGEEPPPDRTKTRWKAVQKKVTYIDFRSELSAYDKFFFHAAARPGKTTLLERKAFIRRKSPHMALSLETGRRQHEHFQVQRIAERAHDVTELQLRAISEILGRRYESIRVMAHRYFDVDGHTVLLKSFGHRYSEAFAGSGEFAVVMLVRAVTNSPPCSLILLDEPEVSLHPGAQRKLMDFLAQQAKAHRHQIVLSTHSPEIIRDLPPNAIKVFHPSETDGRVNLISQESDSSEAFFRLGVRLPQDKTIFVEDLLAAAIVRRAMQPLGEASNSQVAITPLPGGTNSIQTRFVPSFALTRNENNLVMLDGDQRPEDPIPEVSAVPDADMEETVSKALNGKPQLSPDGGGGVANEAQKLTQLKIVLNWVRENVDYLPGLTPEGLLLKMEGRENPDPDAKITKAIWVDRTTDALQRPPWQPVTSEEVLAEQERALANVSTETPEMAEIRARVKRFLQKGTK
ncbi:AAA family ATPase [Micromonospora tulbaghiae]|uniref:ATP-dependent nuclease n=1 Tax=Micromonospora tulbaghiae TaxID=479978 RepID=UPI0033D3DA4D